ELAIELGLEPSHKKVVNFRNIQERIRQLESQRITPVIVLDEAQFLSMDIFEELLLFIKFSTRYGLKHSGLTYWHCQSAG
ncbi:ATP-binding protein, partial [Alkalibacterium indicireducens]|uniref:ATP-binding protein n=1 Tax=Alkalibacterium indicireducens TaxID=398758 RepID=UPI0031F79A46